MTTVPSTASTTLRKTIAICAAGHSVGTGVHVVRPDDSVLHCTTLAALLRNVSEHSVDLVVLAGPAHSDERTVAAVRLSVSSAALLVLRPTAAPGLHRDPVLNAWLAREPESPEQFASLISELLDDDPAEASVDDPASVSRVITRASIAHTRLTQALDQLWMAFQPVVSVRERRVCAYEALLRTRSEEFSSPLALLHEASRLDRIWDVSRTVRGQVAGECSSVPSDAIVLVNLHVSDLFDDSLLDERNPLLPMASSVVFEVTEQASIRCADEIPDRVRLLRERGFRIAVDDLGAGYSALSVLAELEPEIVKVDMSIIRDIDRSLTKQRVIRSIVHLALDLGSTVICEGVETERERDALIALGCDWLQGYWFARPTRGFVDVPSARFGEAT